MFSVGLSESLFGYYSREIENNSTSSPPLSSPRLNSTKSLLTMLPSGSVHAKQYRFSPHILGTESHKAFNILSELFELFAGCRKVERKWKAAGQWLARSKATGQLSIRKLYRINKSSCLSSVISIVYIVYIQYSLWAH